MGRYADNLQRFSRSFGLERIVVLDIKDLMRPGGAGAATRRLAKLLPRLDDMQSVAETAAVVAGKFARDAATAPHLNQAPPLPDDAQPTKEEMAELKESYRSDNQRLFTLIGRDFGWNAVA